MKTIFNIAKSTYKEAVRDRIFTVLLAFGFIFLAATIFLGSISLGEDPIIIKDMGLAGIYLFSLLTTIFTGSNVVNREVERGTSRVVLSKPVTTLHFVIGKFLGLWSVISTVVLLMTVLFALILVLKSYFFFAVLWPSFLLLFELAIIAAISILFAALSSPFAATMYTIVFLFIGHSLPTLQAAANKSGDPWRPLGNAVYYLLPNLEKFNLRNLISAGWQPAPALVFLPIFYAILCCAVLLWLATLLLKHRDN